jgi:hypothetical protein
VKFLAFLATKKGLLLAGAAAFLILRSRKAKAEPSVTVQGETGRLSVTVSSYYDELVGGTRFCYEEGIDADDNSFNRAVPCAEADANGVIGTYKSRSG